MDQTVQLDRLLGELGYILASSDVSFKIAIESCQVTGQLKTVIFEPDCKTSPGCRLYARQLFSEHLSRPGCSLSSVVLWADGRISVCP